MRIFIIRHGDPDYQNDSLTEKGRREAALLADRLAKEHLTAIYCSPLGRAQATAEPTCARTGLPRVTLDWMREFPARIQLDYAKEGLGCERVLHCPWDMPPQYWTRQPQFFTEDWRNQPLYRESDIASVYDRIAESWDALMARHGLRRDGQIYRLDAQTDRNQTIALFCHHGLGLALLSVITRIPLPLVWQTFFLPTSSVTTLYMERMERYPLHPESEAFARVIALGDTSHLYAGDEPISSSGLMSKLP